MENTFHVEVITPQKVVFDGDVIGIVAPGTNGSFEILKNHTAFISSVKIGEMRLIHEDGYEEYYAVGGGFLDAEDNKVRMLAETCEKAADIDINRAKQAHERARKRLEDRSSYDVDQAYQALLRAENRLEIASKRAKHTA